MTNQISTQTLSFYGSDLITLKVEDVIYTAVKPIVKALGLSWGTQKRKLLEQQEKFNWVRLNFATNGGVQEMLCMPLKKLNGWLFSINPEKVRPDLKEKVIRYQEECFEALYNYWYFGKAERKTTVDERTGLRDAVNMLVSKKGLIYSEAYNLVHQRFNVPSIEDLTAEQLPMAVEYVHKICLEGELIINEPRNQMVEIPHEGRWLVIVDRLDPSRNVVRNIDGKSCVDAKLYRQLTSETRQMAVLLNELATRFRMADGECNLSRFDTPLLEIKQGFII